MVAINITNKYVLFKGKINNNQKVYILFIYKKINNIKNNNIIKRFNVTTEELINFGNMVLYGKEYLKTVDEYNNNLLEYISTVIIFNKFETFFDIMNINYFNDKYKNIKSVCI